MSAWFLATGMLSSASFGALSATAGAGPVSGVAHGRSVARYSFSASAGETCGNSRPGTLVERLAAVTCSSTSINVNLDLSLTWTELAVESMALNGLCRDPEGALHSGSGNSDGAWASSALPLLLPMTTADVGNEHNDS